MPTSVPNFNFLARLVSEIWGASQNKKWDLLIPPDAPSGQICIQGASTRKYLQVCQIQLPGFISFRDKVVVIKFNVNATSPLQYTPYAENFMCAQSTWQGQTACRISASYLYGLCSYANRLFIMCPKTGLLGVLRVKMWKYCLLIPKRHYLREYASVDVSHVKIG